VKGVHIEHRALFNDAHCFHPPQSHNRIEFEGSFGDGDYVGWWTSWVPASASIVDISHNLLRQIGSVVGTRDDAFVLLGSASVKWPELQQVDVSHNLLWGYIFFEPPGIHYNFDVSNNNISRIQIGSRGTLSASAYMRKMYTVDWRNQTTPVQFYDRATGHNSFDTIDDALNSIDFQSVDYLPRPNSFEQVEYPEGSGETPFACPLW
jgi:hypothetical protein